MNQTTKPFTDVRVRKALTLGLDRYTASRVLYPIAEPEGRRRADAARDGLGDGGIRSCEAARVREDMEKNRTEARRSWRGGLSQRAQGSSQESQRKVPYIDFGTFVVQEWRKIGIEAEHRPLETAAWFADGPRHRQLRAHRQRVVQLRTIPTSSSSATRRGHQQLGPLLRSAHRRPLLPPGAHARSRRAQEAGQRDREDRPRERVLTSRPLVGPQRRALAKVKNYVAPPNHYSNQKLQDVWLAED
jgi:peptide/nickel transport system substrate-binding protein